MIKSINVICSATGICLGPCWTGVTFLSISRLLVNILAKNPYFFPTPRNFKTLISSLFFYFRKICSHHHCHHFHLRFCWVWSIGWGRWFSVEKLEKEELNIEHFWCGMGWRVFEGKKTLASKNTSISKSAADELKNVLL